MYNQNSNTCPAWLVLGYIYGSHDEDVRSACYKLETFLDLKVCWGQTHPCGIIQTGGSS